MEFQIWQTSNSYYTRKTTWKPIKNFPQKCLKKSRFSWIIKWKVKNLISISIIFQILHLMMNLKRRLFFLYWKMATVLTTRILNSDQSFGVTLNRKLVTRLFPERKTLEKLSFTILIYIEKMGNLCILFNHLARNVK